MCVGFASAGKKIVVPKDVNTIQKALDNAEEGDTVFVLNGKYRGSITLRERVVLMGQDREKTILSGSRWSTIVRGVNFATICQVTIEGGDKGIICENTNTIIDHCIIRNNNTGIQCLVSLPTISNNLIVRNKWSGIFCELVAVGGSATIENNVIAENGYSGLALARQSTVVVQNNCFFNNMQFGIYVDVDSKRSRIVYNNFFGNRLPCSVYAVVDNTNISVDPGYIAAGVSTYDYLGSPALPLQKAGKNGADIGLTHREQAVGDADEDGIADDKDLCVNEPEDKEGFEDADGCPDFDNDLDNIVDSLDACPNEPEDYDNYQDNDGCPDPDNDKDGICDPWVAEKGLAARYAALCKESDACPGQPEVVNGYKDDDGCPDAVPASMADTASVNKPTPTNPAPATPAAPEKSAKVGKKK